MQAILRTARAEGVQSLAIPSLGVGNLNYPADVSAKILFEEIIAFHGRNPNSNMTFHFVVFDQSAYLEFSKVYAQKMNSASSTKKVGLICELIIIVSMLLVTITEPREEEQRSRQRSRWKHTA